MSNGIVVDHRESHVRYAISESNFNEKLHKKVRDLKPGESVRGYRPHPIKRLGEAETATYLPTTPDPATLPENQTEGSSTEGTKDAK